jgi:hypothetical protein
MSTKELQPVNFEQAKKLKELGFDWIKNPCYKNRELTHEPVLTRKYKGIEDICFAAPSVPLALKWIRNKYSTHGEREKDNIIFQIRAVFGNDGVFYVPTISIFKKGKIYDVDAADFPYKTFGYHRDYESAESALLDELLSILEKGL